MKLEKVKSWFYQLQGLPDADQRHEDLLVLDIDVDPAPYRLKPDGTPRAVAAYLSIGEAENYRAYWPVLCERVAKDPLILGENPDWPGNFTVKFWKPEWNALMRERAREAKAKGFTALYLDKVDAYEDIASRFPVWSDMTDVQEAMINLVRNIAYTVPDLDLIMQNAEGLTDNPRLLAAIDGIGKEDLFYGQEVTGEHNEPEAVRWSLSQLHQSRKPVFVIEYLNDPEAQKEALRLIQRVGFVPFFDEEDRALDGA